MKLPIIVALLIILTLSIGAVNSFDTAVEVLDWTNFAFTLGCIVFALSIVNRTSAALGRLFVFITMSLFFFGAIRLFFYLAEHTLALSETTIILGWHSLFYIATGLFIMALHSLKQFGSSYLKTELVSPGMKIAFTMLVLLGITVFFIAQPLDGAIVRTYGSSPLHTQFGLEHVLAFAMMGYAAYLLLRVKHLFGKTVTRAITPLFIMASFFSLLHLWELLTENWHLLVVPETVIEPVEGILYLVAMYGIFVATWQIKKTL